MTSSTNAEIVIIGGGAVGCGVAYSLAQAEKTDVLLIEKEPTVAAVTSSQAAGLVGQVRNSVERTRLAMWSVETFWQLQQDESVNPGWRQVGSLRIVLNDKRVEEFERMKAVADEAGLELCPKTDTALLRNLLRSGPLTATTGNSHERENCSIPRRFVT